MAGGELVAIIGATVASLDWVMTVTGPIAPEKLGITLPHEHFFVNSHHITRNANGILNDAELARQEIGLFREAGGATVVDVTNLGLWRDPPALRQMAADTGLNIVMGCGWYREPFYPTDLNKRTTNSLADEIICELEQGVDGTGIRAGIIGEVGNDWDYVSGVEERSFRAAARAHLHTGATITTHAAWYPTGLLQLDILKDEGVPPKRVIVGHCDTIPDTDYHDAVAASGAWIQFDRNAGRHKYEWQQRLGWIRRLVDNGHLGRLLLSHDVCIMSDLHAYGGTGYDFILTGLVPRLLEAGFSRSQIDQLLVENPRRALTGGD
jgi:phosphotriesterase-related protein